MNYQPQLWYLNGTIVNDERYHQQSWRVLCQRYPGNMRTPTEDEFKHQVFGRSEKSTLEHLLGRPLSRSELIRWSNERVDVVKNLFGPHLRIADGLGQLLEESYSAGVRMAVVSGGSRWNYMNFVLDALKIRQYFTDAIVTADDVTNSKPDPEGYIKGATMLGVRPSECLVFEDTLSGIEAGRRADAVVIAVASTHEVHELTTAHRVISSFEEVRLADLTRIFNEIRDQGPRVPERR